MTRINTKHVIWSAKAAWFLIVAPIALTCALRRFIGKSIASHYLKQVDSFPCYGCGEDISLVGRWECGWCGYVFDGWFFARCVVCGAVPPYVKCQACGVGVKDPRVL